MEPWSDEKRPKSVEYEMHAGSKNLGFWSSALELRDFCQIWTDSIPNQSPQKRVTRRGAIYFFSKIQNDNWVNKSLNSLTPTNNRKIPGSLGEGSITGKKSEGGLELALARRPPTTLSLNPILHLSELQLS